MKKILLIAMGGTISARGKSRIDGKNYVSGQLTGEDFIKEIPELTHIAHIDIKQMPNVSSTLINETDWVTLRQTIIQAIDQHNYDGIVITHGTNTLEETAYFLHVTLPKKQPIALVGSQRPFSSLSSDAHLNLLHACQVAAHPDAQGIGVLVVANGKINSAREVTKTDTYQLDTFQSGSLGPLGFIDPDETVQLYQSPTRLHTYKSEFSLNTIKSLPRVGIIYSYAGATGDLIQQITSEKLYDGIVVAGTGAGRCSPSEDKALEEAARNGIVIVRSSRVGNGRIVNIEDFARYPAVCADNLNPQKARILLMIAMTFYSDMDSIQSVFDTY